MKRLIAGVLILLAAGVVHARGLERYRDWENSPQAYFMTRAERAQWRTVRSDEEAARFVSAYLAKRGGAAFAADVQRRVAAADAFFMNHEIKGALTLRKLMIIFGMPAHVHDSGPIRRLRGTPAPSPEVVTDLMAAPPARIRGQIDGRPIEEPSERRFRELTTTFPRVPGFDGEYTVILEVDMGNGKDTLSKRSKQKDLNARIEAAAAATIRKP